VYLQHHKHRCCSLDLQSDLHSSYQHVTLAEAHPDLCLPVHQLTYKFSLKQHAPPTYQHAGLSLNCKAHSRLSLTGWSFGCMAALCRISIKATCPTLSTGSDGPWQGCCNLFTTVSCAMKELDAVSGVQCKHAGREVMPPVTSVAHLMLKQRH